MLSSQRIPNQQSRHVRRVKYDLESGLSVLSFSLIGSTSANGALKRTQKGTMTQQYPALKLRMNQARRSVNVAQNLDSRLAS